jgi:hypothetical protein
MHWSPTSYGMSSLIWYEAEENVLQICCINSTFVNSLSRRSCSFQVISSKIYYSLFGIPSKNSNPLWYAIRRTSARIIVPSNYLPFGNYLSYMLFVGGCTFYNTYSYFRCQKMFVSIRIIVVVVDKVQHSHETNSLMDIWR